jgi:hypothetical protein
VTVGAFVDVEQLVITWLSEKLPDVAVSQQVPKGTGIRATRSPGENDGVTALPRVDVECFAPDRARMWILAGRANNALAELCGDVVTIDVSDPDDADDHTTLEVQVDDVNTITDPVPGFWSPTVERSVAIYELDIRTDF